MTIIGYSLFPLISEIPLTVSSNPKTEIVSNKYVTITSVSMINPRMNQKVVENDTTNNFDNDLDTDFFFQCLQNLQTEEMTTLPGKIDSGFGPKFDFSDLLILLGQDFQI